MIREELGEENPVSDADEMKEQLKKIKASVEVKERIRKEINRFQNMPGWQPGCECDPDISGDGAGTAVEQNDEG